MMRRVVLFASMLAACGDPLVTEQYAGTPTFEIGGAIVQANARIPASHGVASARLFWIGAASLDGEQPAELGAGFAEFSMTLFDPPPPAAAAFSDRVDVGTLGIAVVAVYADTNDDALFDPEVDRLLGASAQHVVVYTSDGVDAEDPAHAFLGALEPGYHVFEHDRASTCRFVLAADCAPEGGLVRSEDTGDVTLTLWAEPGDVQVPAPALDADVSIWSAP